MPKADGGCDQLYFYYLPRSGGIGMAGFVLEECV